MLITENSKSYRKVGRRKKRQDSILPECSISFRNSVEWKVAGFITSIVYLMDKTTKPSTPFRITLRPGIGNWVSDYKENDIETDPSLKASSGM